MVSVQNEYNLANRKHEDLVDYCTSHKIAFIPWFPLGGHAEDRDKVSQLLAKLTDKYQATTSQLALAWLLQRSPMILPIPGTTSIAHLEKNLQATKIQLSNEDSSL